MHYQKILNEAGHRFQIERSGLLMPHREDLEFDVASNAASASAPSTRADTEPEVSDVQDFPEDDFDIFEIPPSECTVFSEVAISRARGASLSREREVRERVAQALDAASSNQGKRLLPDQDFDIVKSRLEDLRRQFPNFSTVVDFLLEEITLAAASEPTSFRIPPILLHGAPGIGKTFFARHLSETLNVGFDKISGGSLQGGFDLAGTSTHWSNSSVGRVFQLLANGEFACPVMMVDEIDKVADDSKYPITPTLLDLLEPESAREFEDQSLNLRFDASRIIFIATANDVNLIPLPLRSRMHEIEIKTPTKAELEIIIRGLFVELTSDLGVGMEVLDEVVSVLTSSDCDLRGIRRQMRKAIARALAAYELEVSDKYLALAKGAQKCGIGFVR